MWQGFNRRQFPRANFPCDIIIYKKGAHEKISGRTENIGLGGVCVLTARDLDKMSLVDLSIFLEKDKPPIECEARVMWVVKHKDKFDIGMEFLNLEKKDSVKIEGVVQECLKKEA